jgi:hypothetical protein
MRDPADDVMSLVCVDLVNMCVHAGEQSGYFRDTNKECEPAGYEYGVGTVTLRG